MASRSAAARRERARPICSIRSTWSTRVNAIVLAGGSAFGLDAAQGVVRYLEERNIGWQVGAPASCRSCRRRSCSTWRSAATRRSGPTADCGYTAATAASDRRRCRRQCRRGRRGHGGQDGRAGERSRRAPMKGGCWQRGDRACRTGLSSAPLSRSTPSATSSIRLTGTVVAGARNPRRQSLADVRKLLRSGCAAGATARRREHDDRRRRHQRAADESRSQPGRADGRRRAGAGDRSVAHGWRRRHGVCARHRAVDRPGRPHDRRRAGGGSDGRSDRPRGLEAERRSAVCLRRASSARCRRASNER